MALVLFFMQSVDRRTGDRVVTRRGDLFWRSSSSSPTGIAKPVKQIKEDCS